MPTSAPDEKPAHSNPDERPPPPAPDDPLKGLIPRMSTDSAVLLCAVGIALCFFAPWITLDRNISGSKLSGAAVFFWAIPLLALATIGVRKNKVQLRYFGTTTAVVVWLAAVYWFVKSASFGLPGLQWGASLSLMLSLALFGLVGENRVTAAADFVAKKLNTRKGELSEHWGSYMPNIHFSAREFYEKIEAEIRAKRWPDVQLLRVIYTEAGLFSHKREYLRVVRQRQCFDICAAPYGVDYFFSLRELIIPAIVTVRVLLATTLGGFFGRIISPISRPFARCIFATVSFRFWHLVSVQRSQTGTDQSRCGIDEGPCL